MPDNGQLSPQDADIVVRLMSGKTVSPQERQHIIALAASTPPADPRHEALAKAAAVAQGNMGGVLPSAGGVAPAPAVAPTSSPAQSAFAQSIYATPNINANPSGTGAPTLDWLQGVGNLISNPSNTGPAQVLGATNAPQTPIRPGSPIPAELLAQAMSPTQSVAAQIANGAFAGNATGGQGGASAPDNASDVGATTAPPQGGGSPWDIFKALGLAGQPQTADQGMGVNPVGASPLSVFAPSASTNEDPNSPAARQAALGNAQSLQDAGGLAYGGGQLAGMHGIVHPDLGPSAHFQPSDIAGYTFANMSDAQMADLLNSQEGSAMEALALAQQANGGPSSAYFMQPYVKSAMELAPSGVLGGIGVAGNTSQNGPSSNAYTLKAVEDFMKQVNSPNYYLQPTQFLGDTLTRLQNTPVDQFSKAAATAAANGHPASLGPGGSPQLQNVDDQITATNTAMAAAGQLSLSPQAQQNLAKLLAMTSLQYKQAVLSNDPGVSPSYPAYLQAMGLPGMFGG